MTIPKSTRLFGKRVYLNERKSDYQGDVQIGYADDATFLYVRVYQQRQSSRITFEMLFRDPYGEFKTHGGGETFQKARANAIECAYKSLSAFTHDRLSDFKWRATRG